MSDLQLKIASYELKEQTLRMHDSQTKLSLCHLNLCHLEEGALASEEHNNRPWRPMFTDLLQKYMEGQGWYVRATSSNGNGMNMSKNEGDVFKIHYVPLQPQSDNYIPELEDIVISLSQDEKRKPKQVMEDIFAPLQRAQLAYDKVMENGSISNVLERHDQANLAWKEAYDQPKNKNALA